MPVGLLAVLVAATVGATDGLTPLTAQEILARLRSTAPSRITDRGLALDVPVAGSVLTLEQPGASAVELDVESDGTFLVTWASLSSPHGRLYGPPWRYVAVRPGAATLHLELLTARDWSPQSIPYFKVDGAGTLLIRAVRVAAEPASARARDVAWRWAPESIGPTTVNFLTPPVWSLDGPLYMTRLWLLLLIAVALAAFGLLRRRGPALALGALAAALAANVAFAVRTLPALSLAVPLDAEARLREGYRFAPELGLVAVEARARLPLTDRVGVVAPEGDWFVGQTLCLQLAPRPCILLAAGADRGAGISGITQLGVGELDAVVSFVGAAGLPAGFQSIAEPTRRAVVARRQ